MLSTTMERHPSGLLESCMSQTPQFAGLLCIHEGTGGICDSVAWMCALNVHQACSILSARTGLLHIAAHVCSHRSQRAASTGTLPEGRVTRQSVTGAAAAVDEPEPLRQGRSKYGTRLATGAPVGASMLFSFLGMHRHCLDSPRQQQLSATTARPMPLLLIRNTRS